MQLLAMFFPVPRVFFLRQLTENYFDVPPGSSEVSVAGEIGAV